MPIRKRESKRLPEITHEEYATIVAALEGRECPPGGARPLWYQAVSGRRHWLSWVKTRAVFVALPRAERCAIIRRRRCVRLATEAPREMGERLVWIRRHDRLYGAPLREPSPVAPDPNDPRFLLFHEPPVETYWDGTRTPRSSVRRRLPAYHGNGHRNGNGRH